MEKLTEYLSKSGHIPVFKWKVKSNSTEGKYYIVQYFEDKHWECTCTAGMFGRQCRHIRHAVNNFKELKYNDGEDY